MNKKIVLAITPPFNDNYLPIGIGIVKALIKDKYDVKCMDLRLDLKNKIFSYCDDLYEKSKLLHYVIIYIKNNKRSTWCNGRIYIRGNLIGAYCVM